MTMSSIVGAAASKAGRPSGAVPLWTQLQNAPSIITPEVDWHYDSSFLALLSGEIAGWVGAWASGKNLAQSTPARRPHPDPADAVFDIANTEYMVADFSTPLVSADRTVLICVNNVSLGGGVYRVYLDSTTGRLVFYQHITGGTVAWYDGAFQDTGVAAITGAQYLTYIFKAGTGTAFARRNGAQLGGALNHTAKAIGGVTNVGARNDLGVFSDIKLRSMSIFTGTHDPDTTAIEAVANIIMS